LFHLDPDSTLYVAGSPFSPLASRVVPEIAERASLDNVASLRERVAELRALGFQIALDDLGAGYAGLTSFTQLERAFGAVGCAKLGRCATPKALPFWGAARDHRPVAVRAQFRDRVVPPRVPCMVRVSPATQ
jgi:hypothetical protein